jgi:hypothetical protein
MLEFVDGVVIGGEGSCDHVLDDISKVQSSELELWLNVRLQSCIIVHTRLGQDSGLTSHYPHKHLHTQQKCHKYSGSAAQVPSWPDQEDTEVPHSHLSCDAQAEVVG